MHFVTARIRRALAILLLLVALMLVLVGTALAHEHREVGPYEVVVGWVNEPALVEEPNGLDLRIATLEGEEPVTGLEETLQAEVIYGDQVRQLELRPRFGQPGAYTADILPTEPGSYLFHISGTIEDTPIDEEFNSADGEFSDVEPLEAIQFPATVSAAGELQAALVEAREAASTARLLALLGLVAGLAGVVVGGLALARR